MKQNAYSAKLTGQLVLVFRYQQKNKLHKPTAFNLKALLPRLVVRAFRIVSLIPANSVRQQDKTVLLWGFLVPSGTVSTNVRWLVTGMEVGTWVFSRCQECIGLGCSVSRCEYTAEKLYNSNAWIIMNPQSSLQAFCTSRISVGLYLTEMQNFPRLINKEEHSSATSVNPPAAILAKEPSEIASGHFGTWDNMGYGSSKSKHRTEDAAIPRNCEFQNGSTHEPRAWRAYAAPSPPALQAVLRHHRTWWHIPNLAVSMAFLWCGVGPVFGGVSPPEYSAKRWATMVLPVPGGP